MSIPKNHTLADLAAQISAHAKTLTDFLATNKLPGPSFAPDAPASFPTSNMDVEETRFALIQAAEEIRDLALGPRYLMMRMALYLRDTAAC
jgi:hypothetical protein